MRRWRKRRLRWHSAFRNEKRDGGAGSSIVPKEDDSSGGISPTGVKPGNVVVFVGGTCVREEFALRR
ncbi:hypothetical protein M0802_015528 [Mischocyttarus mexicanus]|nr:hypothetical protein M0802_015528 [Mischocyttarus mexicanus]